MGGDDTATTVQYEGWLYKAYVQGTCGRKRVARHKIKNKCASPATAFAYLSMYFAGVQQTKMETILDQYEAQHNAYTKCLTMSRFANEQKAEAAAAGKNGTSTWFTSDNWLSYKEYMTGIMDKAPDDLFEMDLSINDIYEGASFTVDEWEDQCDIINQQKDIESTEMNKLSTDMELSVQDSSEAQEMAANAVKKVSDLASSQAKTSGG